MRLLTKAEACSKMAVSLSTLNRRIAAGEVLAKREPHGRRHRVYVMLDDDQPLKDAGDVTCEGVALAVAHERIRGLEEQVTFLQEQLGLEQERNAGLVNELKSMNVGARRGSWWRFW